jgi:ribosomal protein S12 methylthiotransferase accessory factor
VTAVNLAATKKFVRGTHRTISPVSTIERFGAHARAFGITRIANVTGLDYLGIPVFMAMRPNSRSLSVSQGKGLDDDAAMASALMEAIELAHAENFSPKTRRATYAAMRAGAPAADPAQLPQLKSAAATNAALRWVQGVNLMDGRETWVPFDLVHTDFTVRYDGIFFRSSNGLASGNHPLEAHCAGLCEVIERDATALWALRDTRGRAARRLRLDSVRDPDCRRLLAGLKKRGIAVALWNVTTDVGVPCFICRFREALANERSSFGAAWGAGCHLSREVALLRAVTEAAQSRLTVIAGSRDDLLARDYADGDGTSLFDLAHDAWEQHLAACRFSGVRSCDGPSFERDCATLLARLKAVGLKQAIAVDLTNARYGIPVFRIVVPGLATHDPLDRVKPGRRMRAMAKARKG